MCRLCSVWGGCVDWIITQHQKLDVGFLGFGWFCFPVSLFLSQLEMMLNLGTSRLPIDVRDVRGTCCKHRYWKFYCTKAFTVQRSHICRLFWGCYLVINVDYIIMTKRVNEHFKRENTLKPDWSHIRTEEHHLNHWFLKICVYIWQQRG